MPRDDGKTVLTTLHDEVGARALRNHGVLKALTGPNAGRIISLPKDNVVSLGRSDECTHRFDDSSLSRVHCRILRLRGDYMIQDMESTNGSYLNGTKVAGRAPLHDGDRIQLGKSTLLTFSLVDDAEEEALVRVYEAAVRDPLTGAFNRKALDQRIETELAHAERSGGELSVILVDLDFFKRINDTYGHLGGDAALKHAAGLLAEGAAQSDFVARYGGEEFVILSRGRDARSAVALAEWYRAKLETAPCPYEGAVIPVTMSAGVASLPCCGLVRDGITLLAVADKRLYQAKQSGRNCVIGP